MKMVPRLLLLTKPVYPVVLVAAALFLDQIGYVAAGPNPIRKVVTLLEDLAKEIEAESAEQAKLHEKMQCACKKAVPDMEQEIEDAKNSISALQASIQEKSGAAEQLGAEVAALDKDIAENKQSLAEAQSVRKKEGDEYQAESAVTRTNIAAMDQAIPALRKGMGGEDPDAFLQVKGKTEEKKMKKNLLLLLQNGAFSSEADRELVYEHATSNSKTESSGEIVGILEQMRESMRDNLIAATKQEEQARATFLKLEQSKKGEISAAEKERTEKANRQAKQDSEKATAEENLSDTEAALTDTTQELDDKKRECADEEKLYDENEKARQAEVIGVQEAIKILNSDDALKTFDKTMQKGEPEQPASFLQLSLTSHGKFDALLGKCGDMITLLKQEQKTEDEENDKCKADLAQSALDVQEAGNTETNAAQAVEQKKAEVAAVKDEVAAVKSVLAEIEATVSEESENRKKENAAFIAEQSELSQAVKLLQKAGKKLKETYAAKELLLQEEGGASTSSAITDADSSTTTTSGANDNSGAVVDSTQEESTSTSANEDGENYQEEVSPATTAESVDQVFDSFLSFTQVKQEQPAGQDNRARKGGNIVIILTNMAADVKKDIALLEQQENQEQSDYEKLMKDLAATKKQRKDELTTKKSTFAKLSQEQEELEEDLSLAQDENAGQQSEDKALHENCDYLLKNYSARKEERAGAVDGLQQAIAILRGMKDPSLLQKGGSGVVRVEKLMSRAGAALQHRGN
ncbi:unnamed protein product [Amoebophrya sp. A120]|nr:unnamed protein product [Amoebophrya sp. A120]|eukprot:GSA120T00020834001.1